jgi:hypothetical protein
LVVLQLPEVVEEDHGTVLRVARVAAVAAELLAQTVLDQMAILDPMTAVIKIWEAAES